MLTICILRVSTVTVIVVARVHSNGAELCFQSGGDVVIIRGNELLSHCLLLLGHAHPVFSGVLRVRGNTCKPNATTRVRKTARNLFPDILISTLSL